MIINVVGSNFTGKTTLIERSLALQPALFIDFRKFREYIDAPTYYAWFPEGPGPWPLQARVLRRHPASLAAAAAILRHGGWPLARRYWKHFFIHAMLVDRAGPRTASAPPVILDEGLMKKFLEAVPCVGAEDVARTRGRWLRVVRRASDAMAESLRGLADAIVYVSSDAETMLGRALARQRSYVEAIGEEQLLNRYRIQLELYPIMLASARARGVPVHEINTTDLDAAAAAFQRLLVVLSGRDSAEVVPVER
jgi:hypothetical protein